MKTITSRMLCVIFFLLLLVGRAIAQEVTGTASGEQLLGTSQDDLIDALEGDDQVFAFGGNDHIFGGAGNDRLYGGNGSGSGSGDDVIEGGDGNDILVGEDGTDTLKGGEGNDHYYYMGNSGIDTIIDPQDGQDILFFLNNAVSTLEYFQDTDDLIIVTDSNPNNVVIVKNFFSDSLSEVYVQPDGGYAVAPVTIKSMAVPYSDGGDSGGGSDSSETDNGSGTDFSGNNTLSGTSNRDLIFTLAGNDTIDAGLEDDILLGGNGDDVYKVSAGDGHDLIIDYAGANRIVFDSSIVFSDISSGLMRVSDDIRFVIGSSQSQSVTVKDFFKYANTLSDIQFSDGSGLSSGQIYGAFGVAAPALSRLDFEVSLGTNSANTLTGTDGSDLLIAGDGNDTTKGLAGDDVLVGGAGDDRYEIGLNNGQDYIVDVAGSNQIVFTDGITFSDAASGLQKVSNDLIIQVGTSADNSVRIYEFFTLANTVDEIVFNTGGSITAAQLFGAFGISAPTDTSQIYDILSTVGTIPDADDDGDGVQNSIDECPLTPENEVVDESGCSSSQIDSDNDGVFDSTDMCLDTVDVLTVDVTGCSASQRDSDNDGIKDNIDQCPATPASIAVDGVGCHDSDEDGLNELEDQCPDTPVSELSTLDTYGCSVSQRDTDEDGINDLLDMCPETAGEQVVNSNGCSLYQLDTDEDGISDAEDICPATMNGSAVDAIGCSAEQRDTDGDGLPDSTDPDADNDGVGNADDAFPYDSSEVLDTDGDGVGNNSDTDDDGDSYSDSVEVSAGTDPLDWSNNPWSIASVKSRLPKTDERNAHAYGDDGTYQQGSPRIYRRLGQGVVADKTNNLFWQDNAAVIETERTWSEARSYCDTLELGGINNWRLPSRSELFYLLSHDITGRTYPGSMGRAYFQYTKSGFSSQAGSYRYWTSENSSYGPLAVDFQAGYLEQPIMGAASLTRCVSGVEQFVSDFSNANDTVVDLSNNLMWQDDGAVVDNKKKWADALEYCENLELNNASDWRLPNTNESFSIIQELSTRQISVFKNKHLNTNGEPFWWTSTSYYQRIFEGPYLLSDADTYAWAAYAYPGSLKTYMRYKNYENYTRCVRTYVKPRIATSNIPVEISLGDVVDINASQSESFDGSPLTYVWENLTTETIIADSAMATYSDFVPGNNRIKLSVSDNKGVTVQNYWIVTALTKPEINIVGSLSYAVGSDSILDASSSISLSGDIISYRWIDIDTGEVLSNNAVLNLEYSQVGIYSVRLEITDSHSQKVTRDFEVFVGDDPVASYELNSTFFDDELITADAEGSYDPDESELIYRWYLDGELLDENGKLLIVDGLTVGLHDLRLTVEDVDGFSDSISRTFRVYGRPAISVSDRYLVLIDHELHIDASASISPNGNIVNYRWFDMDAGQLLSTSSEVSVSYTQMGVHHLRLEVVDDQGANDFKTILVLSGHEPIASITTDSTFYEGNALHAYSDSSNDEDDDIQHYQWLLDGNEVGTSEILSVPDLVSGSYTLTLNVTDSIGLIGVDSVTLQVLAPRELLTCNLAPVADDSMVLKEYPDADIDWIAERTADSDQVEKAFNHARSKDPSVNIYMKLPDSVIWDGLTVREKGLYLINSEREARGLKPFSGMDPAIEQTAQYYADYIYSRNEVIGHFNDGNSPVQRMDLIPYTQENRDSYVPGTESVAGRIGHDNAMSDDFILINAIYAWLYQDKGWFSEFDWAVGPEWGHRDHLLMRGLTDNSGSAYNEGVLGFGIDSGRYQPGVNPPVGFGGVAVFNTVDQSDTWDESRLVTVDTSSTHLCVDNHHIELNSSDVPNGIQSLRVQPSNVVFNVGQTVNVQVQGVLANGDILDITEYVDFESDKYSIAFISNGLLTAINTGQVDFTISLAGMKVRLPVLVHQSIADEILQAPVTEALRLYLPDNSANWYYDPVAMRAESGYDGKAISVYTGLVVDENNLPLSAATVSFLNNPRLGSVQTDANGRFVMAGPAGLQHFNFQAAGRLWLQRSGIGSSDSWTTIETVMLLPFDSAQSHIDLSSGVSQVHNSSVVTDDRGSRKQTVIFPGNTEARIVSRDGSERVLDEFLFSVTEHRTPESMPGPLPKETAFTYCSELHVDGVSYDDTVVFDQDVTLVVDNFLGFRVGEIVPIGSFNTITSEWEGQKNGVIVMAVDTDNDGLIDGLDYTGDRIPDDLNENGTVTDEITGLQDYQDGDTFMWGQVRHFSANDMNFAQAGDQASNNAAADSGKEDKANDEEICTGSYVKPYQQSFHEDIAIAGTNLDLHYSSQRTKDYKHKVTLSLSGAEYPERVERMIARLEIGGHVFEEEFAPQANLEATFIWDGKDIAGQPVAGTVRGRFSVGYEYRTNYVSSGNAADDGLKPSDYPIAWAQVGTKATAVEGREAFIAWNVQGIELKNDYPSQIAEGWSISNVHEYDGKNTLYLGDGSVDSIEPATNVMRTGITYSEVVGDDGYYQKGAIAEDYYISTEGTLVDRVTGLTWLYSETPFQTSSRSEARAYCANMSYAGLSNWRLPTSKEKGYSQNKAGLGGNAIYSGQEKWSETLFHDSDKKLAVYCVSGASMDERYVTDMKRNASADVVVDNNSGLMWQDNAENDSAVYDWDQAINVCESSVHAGYDDWRLPNVNELLHSLPNSVFQYKTDYPDNYNPENYWNNASYRQPYWSSTPSTQNEGRAWAVESVGFNSKNYKKEDAYYVRCVRDAASALRSPYVFDASGKHVKTVDIYSGKTLSTLHYNDSDQLSYIEDSFGNRLTIERDTEGTPARIIAPDGQVTLLTIVDGNLLNVSYEDGTSYQFDYSGSLITQKTNPNGKHFGHVFDDNGRVTNTTDDNGGAWTFYELMTAAKERRYGYGTAEGQGYQTIRKVLADGSVQKTTTAEDGSVVTDMLSQDGLLQQITSNTGSVTQIQKTKDAKTLKEVPKVISVTQPSSLASTTVITKNYGNNGADLSRYDLSVEHNGSTSTVVFDSATGVRRTTSAEGRQTIYTHDPESLLLQRVSTSGLNDTTYTYDNRGRMLTESIGDRTTTYSYNAEGQVSSMTTADNKTTSFTYDDLGRVLSTHYPDGHTLENTYDANGNLSSLIVPTLVTHSFSHNAVNKVSGATTPLNESTQYEYDRDRRLTRILLPSGDSIRHIYSSGKRAQTILPEGAINYAYVNGNQLSSVTEGSEGISYQYDGDLLTQVGYSGLLNGSISYGYNNNFDVNQLTYAGSSTGLSYDNDGLLTAIHGFSIGHNAQNGLPDSISDGSYSQSRSYNGYAETTALNQAVADSRLSSTLVYNNIGQISQKTETIITSEGTVTNHYQYGYDNRNRLISVTLNGNPAEAYSYNANGNRISATSVLIGTSNQTATYNNGDQLLSNGNQTYQYDTNGRLQSKTRTTNDGAVVTTTYQYSSDGRLQNVVTPGKNIEYKHNALGNRVAKLINGTIAEKYLWQNKTTLLAIYDANNNLKQRFEYTLGHAPTAFTQNGSKYYILTDQLGTPRLVTDSSGNVVKQISYDSYGNVIEDSAPGFTLPFGFAGGLYDADTGLIRFGYRDYDPEVGRWTARDPIGFEGGDSNLYGYVLGDPVNFVDPDGLMAQAAAIYFVPGAGQVALAATAAVVVGYGIYQGIDALAGWIGEQIMKAEKAVERSLEQFFGNQIVETAHHDSESFP